MIELYTQPYCQGCPEFEPEVHKSQSLGYYDGKRFKTPTDTVIKCKHRDRCREIFDYAERHLNDREESTD